MKRFSKAISAGVAGSVAAGAALLASGAGTDWKTLGLAVAGGFFTGFATAWSPANAPG